MLSLPIPPRCSPPPYPLNFMFLLSLKKKIQTTKQKPSKQKMIKQSKKPPPQKIPEQSTKFILCWLTIAGLAPE